MNHPRTDTFARTTCKIPYSRNRRLGLGRRIRSREMNSHTSNSSIPASHARGRSTFRLRVAAPGVSLHARQWVRARAGALSRFPPHSGSHETWKRPERATFALWARRRVFGRCELVGGARSDARGGPPRRNAIGRGGAPLPGHVVFIRAQKRTGCRKSVWWPAGWTYREPCEAKLRLAGRELCAALSEVVVWRRTGALLSSSAPTLLSHLSSPVPLARIDRTG